MSFQDEIAEAVERELWERFLALDIPPEPAPKPQALWPYYHPPLLNMEAS